MVAGRRHLRRGEERGIITLVEARAASRIRRLVVRPVRYRVLDGWDMAVSALVLSVEGHDVESRRLRGFVAGVWGGEVVLDKSRRSGGSKCS